MCMDNYSRGKRTTAHSQVVSGRRLADELAGCLKEDIRQFMFLESLNLTLNGES